MILETVFISYIFKIAIYLFTILAFLTFLYNFLTSSKRIYLITWSKNDMKILHMKVFIKDNNIYRIKIKSNHMKDFIST